MIKIILGNNHNYTYGGVFGTWRNVTEEVLRTWLVDLKLRNIDLVEYWEAEEAAVRENRDLRHQALGDRIYGHLRWEWSLDRVVGGPEPEGWQFIWDMNVEGFVGEFWELVEDPPIHVPGAWVYD